MNGWTIHNDEAGVLSYQYVFNKHGGTATTFVARIPDDGLIVISPGVKMPEIAFDTLRRYGDVRVVVANNGFHYLGLAEWQARFPDATFHAPSRAAKRIKENSATAPNLAGLADIGDQLGDFVYLREAPQNKAGETWAWVKTSRGNIWFGSDIFCNWQAYPGNFIQSTQWKLSRSGPGFSLNHMAMKGTLHEERPALKVMLKDMDEHPPSILVLSHGHPLTHPGISDEATKLLRLGL